MRYIIILFSTVLLLTSCEKEINLNLEDKSGDIVIEGNVTDEPGPYYVRVTRSVAFTEPNQYPAITDAVVIIKDNTGQNDTLEYIGSGTYGTSALTGIPGNIYTVTVQVSNEFFTATSTMPQPIPLDHLRQDSITFGNEMRYSIVPVFTDPFTIGNYYHFTAKVNDISDDSHNLFSDNTNNGKENERGLFISRPGNDDDDDDELRPGDVIEITMECIDPSIYTYYTALSQISGGGGMGGVTPANPPSNFGGNVLGYFSAHTVSRKEITIQ